MAVGPDIITEAGGYESARELLHNPLFIGGFFFLLGVQILFNVGYIKSEGKMKRFICWLKGCKTGVGFDGEGGNTSAGQCSRCKNTDPAKHFYPPA